MQIYSTLNIGLFIAVCPFACNSFSVAVVPPSILGVVHQGFTSNKWPKDPPPDVNMPSVWLVVHNGNFADFGSASVSGVARTWPTNLNDKIPTPPVRGPISMTIDLTWPMAMVSSMVGKTTTTNLQDETWKLTCVSANVLHYCNCVSQQVGMHSELLSIRLMGWTCWWWCTALQTEL